MKMLRLIAAVLIAVLVLPSSSWAFAHNQMDDVGYLTVGSSGTLYSESQGLVGYDIDYAFTVVGSLAARTKMELDLTLTPQAGASFSMSGGESRFLVDSLGTYPTVPELTAALAGLGLNALSYTTVGGSYIWTLILSNAGTGTSSFAAEIGAVIRAVSGCGVVKLSYDVSSVPLPPALLLFASGAALIGGLAGRKKAK